MLCLYDIVNNIMPMKVEYQVEIKKKTLFSPYPMLMSNVKIFIIVQE